MCSLSLTSSSPNYPHNSLIYYKSLLICYLPNEAYLDHLILQHVSQSLVLPMLLILSWLPRTPQPLFKHLSCYDILNISFSVLLTDVSKEFRIVPAALNMYLLNEWSSQSWMYKLLTETQYMIMKDYMFIKIIFIKKWIIK